MMKYYLFSDTMTDETILYKSTFAGVEQNVASCLEEVKTAEGARLQGDLQFDRDKFWDSLTTAARKVSVTSREYFRFTTVARKVSVTSREYFITAARKVSGMSREYGTVLHYSYAEGQCDVQRVPSSPVISSQSVISSQQLKLFGWVLLGCF
jgi:hypothetical protein